MAKGIRVSEKYGLNPTMGICFFCGKETGEIALMGRMTNGKRGRACKEIEAPKYSVLSYEPCDKCKEIMDKGITLIEVQQTTMDCRPAITKHNGVDMYPTGKYLTLGRIAAERIFGKEITESNKAFVEVGIIDGLINRGGK